MWLSANHVLVYATFLAGMAAPDVLKATKAALQGERATDWRRWE